MTFNNLSRMIVMTKHFKTQLLGIFSVLALLSGFLAWWIAPANRLTDFPETGKRKTEPYEIFSWGEVLFENALNNPTFGPQPAFDTLPIWSLDPAQLRSQSEAQREYGGRISGPGIIGSLRDAGTFLSNDFLKQGRPRGGLTTLAGSGTQLCDGRYCLNVLFTMGARGVILNVPKEISDLGRSIGFFWAPVNCGRILYGSQSENVEEVPRMGCAPKCIRVGYGNCLEQIIRANRVKK